MSMTDLQVVEGAERMARTILREFGYETPELSIRKSINPRAISAWAITAKALEEYNGTDLQSAVDSVDDGDEPPPAPELPVKLGPNHLAMLQMAKIGTCGCDNASADYRQHRENCGLRLLGEVALVVASQQAEGEGETAQKVGGQHAAA